MNDRRNDPRHSDRTDGGPRSRELDADLAALRRESARHLPTLNTIVRAAIQRPRTWEETLMHSLETPSRRPWRWHSHERCMTILPPEPSSTRST